jgi:O-antigen/teichoic acid export membrane protein
LKLPDFPSFDTISEALRAATSRQGIRRVLSTPLHANALYIMLSNAVMYLCSFFFWLIVARFYSEAVVGYSSAIVSALYLLSVLSLVGLNISLVRFLPQADNPCKMMNTCFTLGSLVSLLVAGIFLAGLGLWCPALSFVRENTIFCLAFLLFAVLGMLFTLVDSALLGRRRAGFILSKAAIFGVLRLPLVVLLASYLRTFGVVASWGIAWAVALAVAMLLFLPRVQGGYRPVPALNLPLVKNMWRYSSGNYLAYLLLNAPGYVLPLIVVNVLGAEQSAYFYIAWTMAISALSAIPVATSSSLLAEGSHFEDRLRENVVKSLKFTFLLLIPAAILLAAVGKWLLLAFGHGYSMNALSLLWVFCLSSLPLGVNYIYTGILRVTGRITELIIIWSFIATGVLAVGRLLLPLTGIIGIGYAWLGVQLIVAVYILAGRKLIPPATHV